MAERKKKAEAGAEQIEELGQDIKETEGMEKAKQTKSQGAKKEGNTRGKKGTVKAEKESEESGADAAIRELSIEEAFERLNAIIANLDREEISLEDSFHLYEEGVKLLQHCNAKVDKVEKQIIVLNGAGNRDEF